MTVPATRPQPRPTRTSLNVAAVYGERYELRQLIATGGMAEVFLAHDRLLDRPVAVKRLYPEFAADPSFVERFEREAKAVAKLNHPNIVSVYDWGVEGDTQYLVMEYVDGRTLAEILHAEGRLHPDRAADIGIDVAAALTLAHRAGMVHKDIKAGNIMITTDGRVQVLDFGIARAVEGTDEALTDAGTVMGTATYFSPEQAQGLQVGPRGDLYSLGVVLYEMTVGQPPFTRQDPGGHRLQARAGRAARAHRRRPRRAGRDRGHHAEAAGQGPRRSVSDRRGPASRPAPLPGGAPHGTGTGPGAGSRSRPRADAGRWRR